VTVPLSPGSSRFAAAKRFGEELDRAMRVRKVGAKRLGPLTGTAVSAIGNWRAGLNLPRYGTALRMAAALEWPVLADIVRAARSGRCARCSAEFVNECGTPRRFCSSACRQVDEQLRRPTAGAELAAAIRAELERRRREVSGGRDTNEILECALATYAKSDARRRQRVDQQGRLLEDHRQAVEAMCRGCEPEGRCRDAECALRPVSPLPLIRQAEKADVGTVTPAEGVHGPTHRARWLSAVRAANAERWGRPGEREDASAAMTARWDGMSDEARAEHGRRVSAGIDRSRRSAASRALHARRRAEREAATP